MASFLESFADLTPIPQDDGPRPVVPINYDPSFRATMDIFRAVLQCDELSSRALDLTSEVIDLNAANYTAWHFRRRCLKALSSDLKAELEYVAGIAGENPKNYQIWYHRRVIAEQLDDSEENELAYTQRVLTEDSKNYHAWSHRQWVVRHFGCWEGEMSFVESMLDKDVRNNSAWNQRWFVIHSRRSLTEEEESKMVSEGQGQANSKNCETLLLDDAVVQEELDYACRATSKAPKNQAPWSYVEGLMRGRDYCAFPQVRAHLVQLEADGVNASPPMCAMWINVLSASEDVEDMAKAKQICHDLETRLDTVREKYWAYRGSLI